MRWAWEVGKESVSLVGCDILRRYEVLRISKSNIFSRCGGGASIVQTCRRRERVDSLVQEMIQSRMWVRIAG
jgi:hypothetical protein